MVLTFAFQSYNFVVVFLYNAGLRDLIVFEGLLVAFTDTSNIDAQALLVIRREVGLQVS